MWCKMSAVSVLLLCSLVIEAQAQTYQIKLKDFPDAGKKQTVSFSENTNGTVKVSVMGMVVKDETKSETLEKVYTLTTLKKTDTEMILQKNFTKAVNTVDKKEKPLSYQGRTVLFEKKSGKFEAKSDGDPALPAADLTSLQDSANVGAAMNRVLLPGKAVAVDDTWTVSGDKLAAALGTAQPLDAAKSSVQGKLVKVYQKDGRQCGVLELDLKIALTKLGPSQLSTPLMMTSKVTIDGVIDGTSTWGVMQGKGSMQGKTEIMQGGQTITLEINMQITNREEQSEEK